LPLLIREPMPDHDDLLSYDLHRLVQWFSNSA
jgi:hypothetical protein